MLQNKIAKFLPFRFQQQEKLSPLLIEEFRVVSIDEWNTMYADIPISRCDDDKVE